MKSAIQFELVWHYSRCGNSIETVFHLKQAPVGYATVFIWLLVNVMDKAELPLTVFLLARDLHGEQRLYFHKCGAYTITRITSSCLVFELRALP